MSSEFGTPPAAKDPRGFPGVVILGVLWALVLIALGVVAGHDTLAYTGILSGEPWVERALSAVDGSQPQYWLVGVGVIAIVVGLVLLLAALRPRAHLGRALYADTGVFLLDRGLQRLVATAAEDVDGVDWAKTSGRGSKLRVDVRGLSVGQDTDLEERVRNSLDARVSALRSPPSIQVNDVGRR